jgi:hypothetical protein
MADDLFNTPLAFRVAVVSASFRDAADQRKRISKLSTQNCDYVSVGNSRDIALSVCRIFGFVWACYCRC